MTTFDQAELVVLDHQCKVLSVYLTLVKLSITIDSTALSVIDFAALQCDRNVITALAAVTAGHCLQSMKIFFSEAAHQDI